MPTPYELNRADVRRELKELISMKKLTYAGQKYASGCVIGLLLEKRGATKDDLIEWDNFEGDISTLIGKGLVMTDAAEWLWNLQMEHDDCCPNDWGNVSPRTAGRRFEFERKYG